MLKHLLPSRPAEDRTFEAVEVMAGIAAGVGIGTAAGGETGAAVGALAGALVGAVGGEVLERLEGRAATSMDATAPETSG